MQTKKTKVSNPLSFTNILKLGSFAAFISLVTGNDLHQDETQNKLKNIERNIEELPLLSQNFGINRNNTNNTNNFNGINDKRLEEEFKKIVGVNLNEVNLNELEDKTDTKAKRNQERNLKKPDEKNNERNLEETNKTDSKAKRNQKRNLKKINKTHNKAKRNQKRNLKKIYTMFGDNGEKYDFNKTNMTEIIGKEISPINNKQTQFLIKATSLTSEALKEMFEYIKRIASAFNELPFEKKISVELSNNSTYIDDILYKNNIKSELEYYKSGKITVLGKNLKDYEEELKDLEERYPGNIAIVSNSTIHSNNTVGRYYPLDDLILIDYNKKNQNITNTIIHEILHALGLGHPSPDISNDDVKLYRLYSDMGYSNNMELKDTSNINYEKYYETLKSHGINHTVLDKIYTIFGVSKDEVDKALLNKYIKNQYDRLYEELVTKYDDCKTLFKPLDIISMYYQNNRDKIDEAFEKYGKCIPTQQSMCNSTLNIYKDCSFDSEESTSEESIIEESTSEESTSEESISEESTSEEKKSKKSTIVDRRIIFLLGLVVTYCLFHRKIQNDIEQALDEALQKPNSYFLCPNTQNKANQRKSRVFNINNIKSDEMIQLKDYNEQVGNNLGTEVRKINQTNTEHYLSL